ncbi:MAG: hypothetical protein QOC84_1236 [Bradyrhizobium sp.]|jgi:hypothetical protein|nr:hypothetical protein [Bradyrhizobium sp.]
MFVPQLFGRWGGPDWTLSENEPVMARTRSGLPSLKLPALLLA